MVPFTINDRHVSSSYASMYPPPHMTFSCKASVPLFFISSTVNEELIIASNLANRVLRSFIKFIYFILLLHDNYMKLLGS